MAQERKEKDVRLIDLMAPIYERDGIAIPLSGNNLDLSSVDEQLMTEIRKKKGTQEGDITDVSAMCASHKVLGKPTFFRGNFHIDTDEEVRQHYQSALEGLVGHLNSTNGEGCKVYLKVVAPPPGNIGGHGL